MVSKYSTDLSSAVWVKSLRSSAQGNNCVELTCVAGVHAVRDSKVEDGRPLIFDRDEWRAFIDRVKNDAFDAG